MLDLYFSANVTSVSTTAGGHPVCMRIIDSSSLAMGCAAMGMNMLACSSESQSLSEVDFEAVLMIRNDEWATERSQAAR